MDAPPVTFPQLEMAGRMGNQLWQVAATISIARQAGRPCALPARWRYRSFFGVPDELFAPDDAEPTGTPAPDMPQAAHINESDRVYLQDASLVLPIADELHTWFQPSPDFVSLVDLAASQSLDHLPRPWIGVHVRRGDYVDIAAFAGPVEADYLHGALDQVDRDTGGEGAVVVFSDDLTWSTEVLGDRAAHYRRPAVPPDVASLVDFFLLSRCDRLVLSNSSFSWWAGFLAADPHPIHPWPWYGPAAASVDASLMLMRGWRPWRRDGTGPADADATPADPEQLDARPAPTSPPSIGASAQRQDDRIDLRDHTFIVPVSIDSADRARNLENCLRHLTTHLDTNIIVGEQNTELAAPIAARHGVGHLSIEPRPDLAFHRTHLLNRLTELVTTPYAVNHDADVILPRRQLEAAGRVMRGAADVVYPYDGRFVELDPEALDKLAPGGEPRPLAVDDGVAYIIDSVGGAVFFDVGRYRDAGLENEHLLAWGPEDREREHRSRTLGLDLRRIAGPIFHQPHHRSADSSGDNPWFPWNQEVVSTVLGLDGPTLTALVACWPWACAPVHDGRSRWPAATPEVATPLVVGTRSPRIPQITAMAEVARALWMAEPPSTVSMVDILDRVGLTSDPVQGVDLRSLGRVVAGLAGPDLVRTTIDFAAAPLPLDVALALFSTALVQRLFQAPAPARHVATGSLHGRRGRETRTPSLFELLDAIDVFIGVRVASTRPRDSDPRDDVGRTAEAASSINDRIAALLISEVSYGVRGLHDPLHASAVERAIQPAFATRWMHRLARTRPDPNAALRRLEAMILEACDPAGAPPPVPPPASPVGRDEDPGAAPDFESFASYCAATAAKGDLGPFRRHPAITTMVETVSPEQGEVCFASIAAAPRASAALEAARACDGVGDPPLSHYGEAGWFSPTTLRYAKVATDLLDLFGPLGSLGVIELGVGFGGQCALIQHLDPPASYLLVDLPGVRDLAARFVRTVAPSAQVATLAMDDLPEDADYDLVISNFAFSELHRDLQEHYVDRVLSRSRRGYLIMNQGMPASHRTITPEQLAARMPAATVEEEVPLTHPRNRVVVWGRAHATR